MKQLIFDKQQTQPTGFWFCLVFVGMLLTGVIPGQLTADSQSLARGGNTPSAKILIAQFNQEVEKGDLSSIKLTGEKLLQFAIQPMRAQDERLELFFALTEQAIDAENFAEYQRLIDSAINFQAEFGHFLALHHFHFEPAKKAIVDSLIWLAENNSAKLDDVRIRFVWRVYHYIEALDAEKTFRLLDALFNFGFPRQYSALSVDSLYLVLIQEYMARNQIDEAKKVLKQSINQLSTYLQLWHDNRFQALWPQIESAGILNPTKIVENQLEKANLYLQSDQDKTWNEWIQTKTHIVGLYRSIDRVQQAVHFAEEAIAEVPDSVLQEESYFWLQQELIYAYDDLGEFDQAKQTMEEILAADISESPFLISGYINYALLLVENHQLAEAEIIAQKILNDYQEYANDYGKYFAKAALVCVWQKTGKKNQASQLRKEMSEQASVNYYATMRATLCIEELSLATELYLERLNDPKLRAETLTILSDYEQNKQKVRNRRSMALRDSVIQNARVQRAINRYGRIARWPLPAGYWDDM